MREIGTFATKTHLSEILDSVSHGESFAITKHGKIIACLTPPQSITSDNIDAAINGIIALRKKIKQRGVKMTQEQIKLMRDTGRR